MIIHYNNMIQMNETSYETSFGDGVTWFSIIKSTKL